MTRFRALWERMRATYWAVPSAMAAASVVFSIVMIDVGRALTAQLLSELSWVYTGGPEGARAVLSTIAASMITVAGVTFSITIVVARAVTFVGMLDLAFTEIARYGRSSVSVSCRLLEAVRDLAPCVSLEEDRLALVRQALFVGDRSADAFDNEMDRAELAGCYRAALSALHPPNVSDLPKA